MDNIIIKPDVRLECINSSTKSPLTDIKWSVQNYSKPDDILDIYGVVATIKQS